MGNEVVKQETQTELVASNPQAWGGTSISSRDIVIPKILCMQGLSKLVVDGEAKFGDFVDSMTNAKLGDMKTPLEFIPFKMDKFYIVSRKEGNTFKFIKTEPVTPQNENRGYFSKDSNGIEYKNDLVMQMFVLLPNDMSLPYAITFKGMSGKAGRVLATQMYIRNIQAGLTPASYTMELYGTKTENDKGVFVVLNTRPKRKTTQEELVTAYSWEQTLSKAKVRVDEEETHPESPASNSGMPSEEVPF